MHGAQMHSLAAHSRGRSASHQPLGLRGLAQIDHEIAPVRCIAAASHMAAATPASGDETAQRWRPQDEATIVTAGWLGARERPFSKCGFFCVL